MPNGIVRWYNEQKRFGMIKPSDGSADIFVHADSLMNRVDLREGEFVTYEVQKAKNGRLVAIHVRT